VASREHQTLSMEEVMQMKKEGIRGEVRDAACEICGLAGVCVCVCVCVCITYTCVSHVCVCVLAPSRPTRQLK
jgi:hypothetical protein